MACAASHCVASMSSVLRCLVLSSTLVSTASLRSSGRSSAELDQGLVSANSSIEEKWDKMDEFVGIMFTIACKWKHSHDVDGLAAEKLRTGEISQGEVQKFKKEIQANNMQYVKEACGKIVANGKGKCRQGCAKRWGEALSRRAECDRKCVSSYASFETNCLAKAENLEIVYSAGHKAAAARRDCNEGHCAEFPSVWALATEADKDREVTTLCSNRCSDAKIQQDCKKEWLLSVDMVKASIRSGCVEESTATACFRGLKGNISSTYDTCMASGKATCNSQHSTCEQEGQTNSTFKDAQEFCDSRMDMCKNQVSSRCSAEHKGALEKAKVHCEEADAAGIKSCVSTRLAARESNATSDCTARLSGSCPKTCASKCNVKGLTACLDKLPTSNHVETFCNDFWKLLHESSELDPVTGDPIALLVQAS